MPRILLCLAALALALPAHAAEWTLLPHPATSGVAVYADPATERPRHGPIVGLFAHNPVQAWYLTDYAVPHRWMVHDVLSAKQWVEFDCKRASMRVLRRLYYREPMAQGRVVAGEPEMRAFIPVIPGDPEETVYQAACARQQAQEQQAQATQPAPTD